MSLESCYDYTFALKTCLVVLSSYKQISKPRFISQILQKWLQVSHVIICGKSTYFSYSTWLKAYHSIETALIKVSNDLLMATDKGQVSVVFLIDLSTAFHRHRCIILIQRQEQFIGLDGSALHKFHSYFRHITLCSGS